MRISDWSSDVCSSDLRAMGEALDATEGKALIFCRTGMRSTTLWALSQADRKPVAHLLGAAGAAGYDLAPHKERLKARQHMAQSQLPAPGERYDVVIVGGGAGGIASAASILRQIGRAHV